MAERVGFETMAQATTCVAVSRIAGTQRFFPGRDRFCAAPPRSTAPVYLYGHFYCIKKGNQ